MPKTIKDSTTKESTTAKPKARKTSTKVGAATKEAATKKPEKATQAPPAQFPSPAYTDHDIAELAYQFWAQRDWQHGDALSDWLRAEHQLRTQKAA